MRRGNGRWATLAIGGLCALTVAACGSSKGTGSSSQSSGAAASSSASSNPRTLLNDAFDSNSKIKSGVLSLQLTITPTGSRTITEPVSLAMTGPFASTNGKLTKGDLTVNASVLGKHATFGFISIDGSSYVRLEGETYKIPSAQGDRFNQFGSVTGLQSLGIDPQTWFPSPTDVGSETIDGVATEHIHAAVDVSAMLLGINKLIAKESSMMGQAGRAVGRISPAERAKIAAKIENPTVDVWVGKSDGIVRRFDLHLTVPVTGQLSTKLGGMTSAGFGLTSGYAQVNVPQTITAPANPLSFAALEAKLQGLLPQLEGAFGGLGAAGGTAGGTPTVTSPSAGTGTGGGSDVKDLQKYEACTKRIQATGVGPGVKQCQKYLNAMH